MKLLVDPNRELLPETGIYVRAMNFNDTWVNADIAHLTKESLLEWLKRDGGDNRLAEDTVGILLGYGTLNK